MIHIQNYASHMRGHLVPLILITMIQPLSARSDDIPTLDVRPVCHGIASQSADPLAARLKATFEECVKSEQDVRGQMKQAWPTFSAADKNHCVALAKTGGESSYTELLTCLEMSRDVRALTSAATTPQKAGVTEKTAAGPPTTKPASSDKALQPTAPRETLASETGEPKKELERAKSDAFTAKASEASAQRKLADAEAALQRVKEEAARATAGAERAKTALQQAKEESTRASAEAERAKADARVARDSEEAAKRNLADAEAARVAAEGREQACHSEAAKAQKGLGARFRSWFGPKRPDANNP
jgi:hypothetical protein